MRAQGSPGGCCLQSRIPNAAQEKEARIGGSLTLWPVTKLCICRARLHKAAPKRMTREERNASGAMIELTKYP